MLGSFCNFFAMHLSLFSKEGFFERGLVTVFFVGFGK